MMLPANDIASIKRCAALLTLLTQLSINAELLKRIGGHADLIEVISSKMNDVWKSFGETDYIFINDVLNQLKTPSQSTDDWGDVSKR